MNNLKWLSVLCLATACGASNVPRTTATPTTSPARPFRWRWSAADPSLAPHVAVPKDVKVKGHSRPVSSDDSATSVASAATAR